MAAASHACDRYNPLGKSKLRARARRAELITSDVENERTHESTRWNTVESCVIQVVESWAFIDRGINNHEVVLEKLRKKIYIRPWWDEPTVIGTGPPETNALSITRQGQTLQFANITF